MSAQHFRLANKGVYDGYLAEATSSFTLAFSVPHRSLPAVTGCRPIVTKVLDIVVEFQIGVLACTEIPQVYYFNFGFNFLV
jgi:hypothetical protein